MQELKEKKKWGRLQKAKGDMALLAGSPRDAFEHYKCALELSTKSSDFIW
jgi:alkylated DNA repair dioxygenase AlkB